MARLLVSVVSAAEVAAAVVGGAAIVDVKDPREGSLGAPRPATVRAVRAATPAAVPVSVALGDLPHLPGTAALAAAGAVGAGAAFVKAGLWGSRDPDAARTLIEAVAAAAHDTDPEARVIATAYADGASAGLLPIGALPAVAAAAGADGCMLDTLGKGTGGLRDALPAAVLAGFVEESRRLGLLVALAGALTERDLAWLLEICAPDIVGVRGAACIDGRRDAPVDEGRVRGLVAVLAQHHPRSAR